MKKSVTYLIKIISVVLVAIFCIILTACEDNKYSERDLIRFHIRANSNSVIDQQVKLKVRDKIVAYLEQTSLGDTPDKAYRSLKKLMPMLKDMADEVLKSEGFDYSSTVTLDKRYFPARSYGETVIPDGYYNSLIIQLGNGQGENWWCVVYPPLCYLEAKAEKDVRYKSKIVEFIKKYFCLSR